MDCYQSAAKQFDVICCINIIPLFPAWPLQSPVLPHSEILWRFGQAFGGHCHRNGSDQSPAASQTASYSSECSIDVTFHDLHKVRCSHVHLNFFYSSDPTERVIGDLYKAVILWVLLDPRSSCFHLLLSGTDAWWIDGQITGPQQRSQPCRMAMYKGWCPNVWRQEEC